MVFEISKSVTITLFLIFFLWLGGLSYIVLRMVRHYQRLAKGSRKETLREILDSIVNQQKKNEDQISSNLQSVKALEKMSKMHIQKIGVVRFNPFADTGGSQSFILSFLDEHDNGIVVSSLHKRTGTRWYVKTVSEGKGIEHRLSKEELEAIKKAKKKKL